MLGLDRSQIVLLQPWLCDAELTGRGEVRPSDSPAGLRPLFLRVTCVSSQGSGANTCALEETFGPRSETVPLTH